MTRRPPSPPSAKARNARQLLEASRVLELAHGIARADTVERRERRHRFLDELLAGVPVQPLTIPIALRAGRSTASDLLIGVTALELGYSVGTSNVRHFQFIPGLNVILI